MDKSNYQTSEQIIKADLVTAREIYVDLSYLKYLELGKILSSPQMDEPTYQQILERMSQDSFIQRPTEEVIEVFREISLPSPGRDDNRSVLMSPGFDHVIEQIREFITQCRYSQTVLHTKDPITVTIGMSNTPYLSSVLTMRLRVEYTKIFNTEVVLTHHPLKRLEKRFDAYFLAQLAPFTEAYLEELDQHKFIEKFVVCRRVLPLSQLPELTKDPDKIELTFTNIELVMAAATQFSFSPPPACLR